MNTSQGYANSRAGVGVPTAARELQIPAELTRLSSVLDEHEKMIAVLGDRIRPFLRDEPTAGDCSGKAVDECLVPIADQLRTFRRRVQRMGEQIQGMVERCEA